MANSLVWTLKSVENAAYHKNYNKMIIMKPERLLMLQQVKL